MLADQFRQQHIGRRLKSMLFVGRLMTGDDGDVQRRQS
jgi:hypothetical protein